MSFLVVSNIPVFIVFQQNQDGENDDVDSVVSSYTAATPYQQTEDLWDSESRWVEESCFFKPQPTSHQKRRSLPQQGPHHPERSLSFSSNQLNKSSGHYSASPQHTTAKNTIPCRHKRTTRLTRMAERAKAVATRAPTRRKSFHRHTPPHLPLRKGSSDGRSSLASSSSTRLDGSCSCSGQSSSTSATASRTGTSHNRRHSLNLSSHTAAIVGVVATTTTTETTTPTARRRNSIQCILGLEPLKIFKQHSTTPDGRPSAGCFQIACGGATNRPPRLPERHPSECPPTVL